MLVRLRHLHHVIRWAGRYDAHLVHKDIGGFVETVQHSGSMKPRVPRRAHEGLSSANREPQRARTLLRRVSERLA